MLTVSKRKEFLELLSGNRAVRLTSHGCGSRTQLAYRIGSTLFDRQGNKLEGAVCDDMLLATARMVRDKLSKLLD